MPQGKGEASQELTQVSTKGLICQRLRLGSHAKLPQETSQTYNMQHMQVFALKFTQVGTLDMYISLSGCPNDIYTKVTKVYTTCF